MAGSPDEIRDLAARFGSIAVVWATSRGGHCTWSGTNRRSNSERDREKTTPQTPVFSLWAASRPQDPSAKHVERSAHLAHLLRDGPSPSPGCVGMAAAAQRGRRARVCVRVRSARTAARQCSGRR
jgi:hypothetical protein